jgi:hypothetical protein
VGFGVFDELETIWRGAISRWNRSFVKDITPGIYRHRENDQVFVVQRVRQEGHGQRRDYLVFTEGLLRGSAEGEFPDPQNAFLFAHSWVKQRQRRSRPIPRTLQAPSRRRRATSMDVNGIVWREE